MAVVNYNCWLNIDFGTWCQLGCVFRRPGTTILATVTTIENLPIVNYVWTVMEAMSQPSFVLAGRVFADLSGSPTYESCWYCLSAQKESDGTQV